MKEKKKYIKPLITRVDLDKSLNVMMISNPHPRGRGHPPGHKGIDSKGMDEQPFKSPFGDKPFG